MTWLSTTNLRIRRCRSSRLGIGIGLGWVGTRRGQVLTNANATSLWGLVSSGRGMRSCASVLRPGPGLSRIGPGEELARQIVGQEKPLIVRTEAARGGGRHRVPFLGPEPPCRDLGGGKTREMP